MQVWDLMGIHLSKDAITQKRQWANYWSQWQLPNPGSDFIITRCSIFQWCYYSCNFLGCYWVQQERLTHHVQAWEVATLHYNDVKSPASRLFTQAFIQAQIKENIETPRHWPLCWEFTGDREFPAQRASNAENVSIWWRHHEVYLLRNHSQSWQNIIEIISKDSVVICNSLTF